MKKDAELFLFFPKYPLCCLTSFTVQLRVHGK